MVARWRVEDGVLVVGDLAPARFLHDAFVVRDSRGGAYPFSWDEWQPDGLSGWRFGAFSRSGRWGRQGIVPGAGVEHGDPRRIPGRPLIVVMSAAGRPWMEIEMPNALAHLLHERRDLRERLRDVERIRRLADDISKCRSLHRAPHEPLAGHRLDAYLAVERALGSRNWHHRHPLVPQALPDRDGLIAVAAQRDPRHAPLIVDQWLSTAPWPFAALAE